MAKLLFLDQLSGVDVMELVIGFLVEGSIVWANNLLPAWDSDAVDIPRAVAY